MDTNHVTNVCTLQWLHILVNNVPCLENYKIRVNQLYLTVTTIPITYKRME
jgi:hypothetical protein